MDTAVEISFSCLPLRSIGRLDVPIDASGVYRIRYERLRAALDKHPAERTYYLYDAHCTFRLANSEIAGMIRYSFEGIVRTDAGDAMTEQVDLEITLASGTCGGIPAEVQPWLQQQVQQAVAVEFNRYIAAGQLNSLASEIGQLERLSDLDDFSV